MRYLDYDMFDMMDMGRGYDRYGFDGEVNRNSFAPVSDRARKALNNVRDII